MEHLCKLCVLFGVLLLTLIVKARTEAHENGAVDLMMTVLDRHIKESSVAHPGSGALKVLAAVGMW